MKNATEIQLREEIFYRYTLDGHTILLIKKIGLSGDPVFCRPAGPAGRRDNENMVNDNSNEIGLLFCL